MSKIDYFYWSILKRVIMRALSFQTPFSKQSQDTQNSANHVNHVLFERINRLSTLVLKLYSHFSSDVFSIWDTGRCNTIFGGAVGFSFGAPDSSSIYILNSLVLCNAVPLWPSSYNGTLKVLCSYTVLGKSIWIPHTPCGRCKKHLAQGNCKFQADKLIWFGTSK